MDFGGILAHLYCKCIVAVFGSSADFLPAAWPVPAHSVAICEGLEDWGAATDFSNISDSDEEDQPAPLVRVLLPL